MSDSPSSKTIVQRLHGKCGLHTRGYASGECVLCDAADEIERLRFSLIQMANAQSKASSIAASTILYHVTGLRWRDVASDETETPDPLASKDHGIAASADEIDEWREKYLRVLSERDRALALLKQYLAEFPAFRSKPVGAPHSKERSKQDSHIALENLARKAFDRPADETTAEQR